MNQPFTESYAIIEDFKGSHVDYYIECCKLLMLSNEVCKETSILYVFALYNM